MKTGDRVRYFKGTDYAIEAYVDKEGVVQDDDYRMGLTVVRFDGEKINRNIDTRNLLVLSVPVVTESTDPTTAVFEKYVEEFDKIIALGTAVPRYTAIGFLVEFRDALEAAEG